MNRFNSFVRKLNFKKVIIVYLIVSVLAGILSVGFLAYTFRDKLTFAYAYHQISEKVSHNKYGIENLKTELSNLSNKSSDMVDILILDSKNKIMFSAKNSDLSKRGTIELLPNVDGGNRFLMDKENPDAYFKLIKGDKHTLSMTMLGVENKVEQDYKDRYFYEKSFDAKKVYLLSYIMDKSNGYKTYFISDVHPVAGGVLYIKAVAALATLLFMLYWVLLALWVYAQALKSRQNAAVWGLITLFTNLAGLFVFLIYKQGHQACYKCGALQNRSNIYCTFCGTKIGFVCKKCNMPVSENDSYCKNCGNALCSEQEGKQK
ncbi:MAG: zinc ribbon domain-containing protein [Bacillota bacterium]|nr:zinc ribbon domain-containing protein [Bacillota bacterium]